MASPLAFFSPSFRSEQFKDALKEDLIGKKSASPIKDLVFVGVGTILYATLPYPTLPYDGP